MMQIPISAVPNQEFSLILDGNTWDITIKTNAGITSVSLTLNGVDLLDSALAVAGYWIIPSFYEEAGNFFFLTQNFQLPIYPQFGLTQYLIYMSPDDLTALRAPSPPPVTAAEFNPIAPVPARFAPSGYT